MSAFFVTENTIADAVECMRLNGHRCEDMAHNLWRMNARALFERYGDKPEEFEADIVAYANPHPSNDPYQLLKSATCLLYQCSEGNVPETTLYGELERATEALSDKLGNANMSGTRSARYEQAKWDR